jgi:hypothetical protein
VPTICRGQPGGPVVDLQIDPAPVLIERPQSKQKQYEARE